MADKERWEGIYGEYIEDQTKKRDGHDVPDYILHEEKKDANFFFGTKSIAQSGEGVHYVGKPQECDGHVLVVGGAGSGKSTCIAMPTLETWGGTIFAIDIKGELTKYWKQIKGPKRSTKILNLTREKKDSSSFDPFYLLHNGNEDDLVQNAREIAHAIIPLPPNVLEPFWIQSAQHVLTAVLLNCYGNGKSFIDAMNRIQTAPLPKLIAEIGNCNGFDPSVQGGERCIEAAKMHINQFLIVDDMSDEIMENSEYLTDLAPPTANVEHSKMLMGIGTELSNKVMVFATDPRVKSAFTPTKNSIKWESLGRCNIFLRLSEDKLGQWDGAITMMLTQLIRTLERRPDKKYDKGAKNPPPVLLLLDEFPRLGKVDVIQNAVSTLRSKGVTICLIMQSLAQLDKTYGRDSRQIIVDNCQYKAILNVTDPENQRIFSDMVGSITVPRVGVSTGSSDMGGDITTNRGSQFSESREPILYPHEFAALGKRMVLMTPEGFCRVNHSPCYPELKDKEIKAKGFVVKEPLIPEIKVGYVNSPLEKNQNTL